MPAGSSDDAHMVERWKAPQVNFPQRVEQRRQTDAILARVLPALTAAAKKVQISPVRRAQIDLPADADLLQVSARSVFIWLE